jgi:hypothetical protein
MSYKKFHLSFSVGEIPPVEVYLKNKTNNLFLNQKLELEKKHKTIWKFKKDENNKYQIESNEISLELDGQKSWFIQRNKNNKTEFLIGVDELFSKTLSVDKNSLVLNDSKECWELIIVPSTTYKSPENQSNELNSHMFQTGMFIVLVALLLGSLRMNYGITGLKIMVMNICIPFVQFVLQKKKRIVLNKKDQRVGDSLRTSLKDMVLKLDI